MKKLIYLLLTLALFSISSRSQASIISTFDYIIGESDSVSIITVTSGKCVTSDCTFSKGNAAVVDYTFLCDKALYGNCPTKSSFQIGNEACVSCKYVVFSKNNIVMELLEIRNNSSRVVYHGRPFSHPIPLHASELPPTSKFSYQYFELVELVKAVRDIKEHK